MSAAAWLSTIEDDARTHALVLHERTNDRSLVMTSSFTNMVLAARFLGFLDRPAEYQETVHRVSGIAGHLLMRHAQSLAEAARDDYRFALYLGAGCRLGAAHEASLKMMEMSAGRTRTMVETYLGLRHGPMAADPRRHADRLLLVRRCAGSCIRDRPHSRAEPQEARDGVRSSSGRRYRRPPAQRATLRSNAPG